MPAKSKTLRNLTTSLTVVGLGESLFDVFDDRQVLGGAPLNGAVHAHQLLAPLGGRGITVTRVGHDQLGDQVLAELTSRQMQTDWVQRDARWPTGRGLVTLEHDEPTFEIVADVAWDWLEHDAAAAQLAASCHAVSFGTLGQRCEPARHAIQQFVEHAPQALRMFDVNLRQQYYSRDAVRRSCELANLIKVNQHELPVICELLELAKPGDTMAAQASALLKEYHFDAVVITRGAAGTLAVTPEGAVSAAPVSYPRDSHADSVGAGDACGAGLLVGLLLSGSWAESVALANSTGAFVASMPGATPTLPREILERVARLAAGVSQHT